MSATPPVRRPRFVANSPLRAALERRVDDYFAREGLDPRGGWRFARKSALILTWALASYLLLLLWASTWWAAATLSVSLGLAVAGIGFAIMHDGAHGSASSRRWVNRLGASTLDLIGGASYFWHHKHDVVHHTFTNVVGVDNDIEAGPFLRLAPTQPRRWYHRFQHLYEIPLLSFFAAKWTLLDDYITLRRPRIGTWPIPRPRGWDLAQLLAGKLTFLGWALILPLALHAPGPVLGCFALAAAVAGITLGMVFQLAHVVEGTEYATHVPGGRLELPFFEHQLATTADFAPRSRLLGWYVGGLNFQVIHHLFPKVSHVHYPALSAIVAETCTTFGVPYRVHDTLWGALRAHFRRMRRLGRGDDVVADAATPPAATSMRRAA